MNKNILIVVVLFAFLVGGYWYMKGSKTSTDPLESAMPVPGTTGIDEMVVSEDVKEIMIEGSEFKIMPNALTLKKGEKIRLVFNNTGSKPHDFRIDEFNVQTKVTNAGESDTVEFTPDKMGTFEYYCSVGQHRANGMTGTLTVL